MKFVEEPGIDFSELDSAHCLISDLQTELVVARMGDATDDQKQQAHDLITELKKELDTVNAVLTAVKNSRDFIQHELNEVKKQCLMQRKEINKIKALKAA
jgi:hypothetical protein